MTYQEFQKAVCQQLSDRFDAGTSLSCKEILKNNNRMLHGLVIQTKDFNIAPTIYLDYYFQRYEEGDDFEFLLEEIYQQYRDCRPKEDVDVTFFTDYDLVKDNIVFKLIHREKNAVLLEDLPYIPYLDLAIVFLCSLSCENNCSASILIHKSHMALWGATVETLMALAVKNTPRLFPMQLLSMEQFFRNQCPDELSPELLDCLQDSVPMYILSNHSKINGASVILYEDLLPSLARRFGSGFYVIPSSIHEVLILPHARDDQDGVITDMVRQVNDQEVAETDVLSDHAYYFDPESGQLQPEKIRGMR